MTILRHRDRTGPAAPTAACSLAAISLLLLACSTRGTAADTGAGGGRGGDATALDAITLDATALDTAPPAGDGAPPGSDLDARASDFECLTKWTKVRRFRITNKVGRLKAALAVARSPTGGVYPPGTIIQLVPFEAMVKRRKGWSPKTGDWEFFSLQASKAGTKILKRGTTTVVNQFGGNCFDCHAKAKPQWDFICEQSHGCDPIPLSAALIDTLQKNDPRCASR